jgi:hypothetical protein
VTADERRVELLGRPDAAATISRLTVAVGAAPKDDLHVELVALAVLSARQAAERQATA